MIFDNSIKSFKKPNWWSGMIIDYSIKSFKKGLTLLTSYRKVGGENWVDALDLRTITDLVNFNISRKWMLQKAES
jgi:hypothetical protein